eukprot:6104249-Amphidinium_carterae.1
MPRVKLNTAEAEAVENCPLLDSEQATAFRSATLRAAYLGQDKVDIPEIAKCLAQAMSKTHEGHMAQLRISKRLARYMEVAPRCAPWYAAQIEAAVAAYVDSDWARDPVTRPSTTGMLLLRGKHLLRHSPTVQAVIGLTSAESEYYALTKDACVGLGLQSHLADWQMPAEISLHRLVERTSSSNETRCWQEHTSHPNPFALVGGTRGGKPLASEEVYTGLLQSSLKLLATTLFETIIITWNHNPVQLSCAVHAQRTAVRRLLHVLVMCGRSQAMKVANNPPTHLFEVGPRVRHAR